MKESQDRRSLTNHLHSTICEPETNLYGIKPLGFGFLMSTAQVDCSDLLQQLLKIKYIIKRFQCSPTVLLYYVSFDLGFLIML